MEKLMNYHVRKFGKCRAGNLVLSNKESTADELAPKIVEQMASGPLKKRADDHPRQKMLTDNQ